MELALILSLPMYFDFTCKSGMMRSYNVMFLLNSHLCNNKATILVLDMDLQILGWYHDKISYVIFIVPRCTMSRKKESLQVCKTMSLAKLKLMFHWVYACDTSISLLTFLFLLVLTLLNTIFKLTRSQSVVGCWCFNP